MERSSISMSDLTRIDGLSFGWNYKKTVLDLIAHIIDAKLSIFQPRTVHRQKGTNPVMNHTIYTENIRSRTSIYQLINVYSN
jgi:hypothetical protein